MRVIFANLGYRPNDPINVNVIYIWGREYSVIKGTPQEVLNDILDKLKKMGVEIQESDMSPYWYRIVPPKETSPDVITDVIDDFQDDFERDSFEAWLKSCPLDQWDENIRRKLALWIHDYVKKSEKP